MEECIISTINQTFKGLWQGDVKVNNEKVSDWKIIPLEMKKQWIDELIEWQNISKPLTGPAMYGSVLNIDDEVLDTYIDTRGWGKGYAFVNGFSLGRYAALGPQKSPYLPGPFLKTGENQINLLEHFYAPEDGVLKFTDKLVIEEVR